MQRGLAVGKRDESASTDPGEIEALRERVRAGELSERDAALVDRLLGLLLTLISVVESKNLSIKRLKRLLFGPGPDKRRVAPPSQSSEPAAPASAPAEHASDSGAPESKKRPGHGRRRASSYTGAAQVRCEDVGLAPGAPCPDALCSGTLYDTNRPSIFIRLTGQPLVGATRYEQQVVRCSACQQRYTARLPDGVAPEKYDATADVAIAMAKYAAGLPFYRLARMQNAFGVPLPESVQWERAESVADALLPIHLHLRKLAASGTVLFADDTSVKILSCMKENAERAEGERTGTHTTGIVSRVGPYQITLFSSGRRHAGENIGKLLELRDAGMASPIQTGDASSSNWSHAFVVLVSKCLAHARRQFVEIEDAFPDACKRVLDDLAVIYRNDAETSGKTVSERLAYHQKHSAPVMDALRAWIGEQMGRPPAEPNNPLGKALAYLARHWTDLTLFLRDGRAPLDSNVVERALKLAVLHRKNAYFYRTEHGAAIADMLMGIVETCRLNHIEAWDYLVTVVRNARAARARPCDWLPWTYRRAASARRVA